MVKRKNNKFSNAESIVEEVNDAIQILTKLMQFSLFAREEEWKDLIYKLDNRKLRNRPKVEDVLALNFKEKRNCKILDDLTRQIQHVGSLIEDINNIEKRWKEVEFEFRIYEKTPLIYK